MENHNNIDSDEHFEIVRTKYGLLRGKKNHNFFEDKPLYSFLGIPYAKPPIGALRFQPPVRWDSPWDGVRDALEFENISVQYRPNSCVVRGDEDCLYLNVFVPDMKPIAKLPVMIYITGGGYNFGSADAQGTDFLCYHDVIVVTFEYRLGPLGFMSLGTPEYPGNMGLKDQLMVFEWVYENIENFGGDRTNITLFGNSSGAASADFHLHIPRSRKFFQKAIIISGCMMNQPFYYSDDENHINLVKEFAAKKGCDTDNVNALLDFLMTADPNELTIKTYGKFFKFGSEKILIGFDWVPIIKGLRENDPFWFEEVDESQLDVDVLIAFNSSEMISTLRFITGDAINLQALKDHFKIQLPGMRKNYDFDNNEYRDASKYIRNFYFPNGINADMDTYQSLVNLLSDTWIVYGLYQTTKVLCARTNGNVYVYLFALDTELNVYKKQFGCTNMPGAGHTDDITYTLKVNVFDYNKLAKDSDEIRFIKQMSKIQTNFAKTGNPNLNKNFDIFKPVKNGTMNYVHITNKGLVPKTDFWKDRMSFWDNLMVKYPTFADSVFNLNYF